MELLLALALNVLLNQGMNLENRVCGILVARRLYCRCCLQWSQLVGLIILQKRQPVVDLSQGGLGKVLLLCSRVDQLEAGEELIELLPA